MFDVDTFLVILYVMVDDFCKQQEPRRRQCGPAPALTESELVTLLLFSRWYRFASDSDFYRYASDRLRSAFPQLPDYGQFNRQARKAATLVSQFSHWLSTMLGSDQAAYEALDTMGCRTRNIKRRGCGWLVGSTSIGYCNRLGWYEGFNVITAVTPTGVITGLGFAPASTKEQPFADTFLAARAQRHPALPEVGQRQPAYYLADNGFCGQALHQEWFARFGLHVVTPPQRTKACKPWPKPLRRWLASHRQIVETVHHKLLETFRLDRERPKELQGFRIRLIASAAMHNFCMLLNQRHGRALLAFADLLRW